MHTSIKYIVGIGIVGMVWLSIGVTNVAAYSAGGLEHIPQYHAMTGINYGSDDDECTIGLRQGKLNADGTITDKGWKFFSCPDGGVGGFGGGIADALVQRAANSAGRATSITTLTGDVVWAIVAPDNQYVTGWTWGADTSGGREGHSQEPRDECYYQQYRSYDPTTKQLGAVSTWTSPQNGTCNERGYYLNWLRKMAQVDDENIVTGIVFGLDNDADVEYFTAIFIAAGPTPIATLTPTPTPTPTLTPTSTPPPGEPLSCTPKTQNVKIGEQARLRAWGGNGTYTWSNGGNPSGGTGSTFRTIFSNPGTKSVRVRSGGITKTCTVVVEPLATPTLTPTVTPTITPTETPQCFLPEGCATPTPTPTPTPSPTPAPHTGLREGDVISSYAYNQDPDIFIINSFSFKRLFLNPIIFSFYGHLTGGYANVKQVPASVRNSYVTSGLFRNCETNDQKVWALQVTGEDTGILHWVNVSGADAVRQDPDFFKKVFCINSNEYTWYPKSAADYTSLLQIPTYNR